MNYRAMYDIQHDRVSSALFMTSINMALQLFAKSITVKRDKTACKKKKKRGRERGGGEEEEISFLKGRRSVLSRIKDYFPRVIRVVATRRDVGGSLIKKSTDLAFSICISILQDCQTSTKRKKELTASSRCIYMCVCFYFLFIIYMIS